MQNITAGLVISAVVAAMLGATLGISVSYQKAFAGASNAQGQCYASQNKSLHSSQVSGESVKDTRDAVCPPPVGLMKGHTK